MIKNIRKSKQRDLIERIVKNRFDHPSADDIYLSANKIDKHISKGTVYRNLNLLSEMGRINHIRIYGSDRFDSRIEPHNHLMCDNCGKVVDVFIDYDKESDILIADKYGYIVFGHNLIFNGICPDCKNKI